MKRIYFILLFVFATLSLHSQRILMDVDLPQSSGGIDIPVSFNFKKWPFAPGTSLVLYERLGSEKIETPFQITQGDQYSLYWLIKPGEKEQTKRKYELTTGVPTDLKTIVADRNDQSLTIHAGNKNFLRYHHAVVYPPVGVDTVYRRSGFIHPLWSPHGQELTRINPPDHYHHYGIWNPWTQVLFKNDTIDFWNLGGKKGTVRFAKFISTTNGSVFSEFRALHEHVVTRKNVDEEVIIREQQIVRVYRPDETQNYYIVDFTSELTCATEYPVTLLEYRYGGFAWRATEQWHKGNSEVLTSEEKTRSSADGTKARWFTVQGEVDNDYAGIVLMSNPTNYNHPEPLRIWPENQNERGDVFVNFSPTKDKDWKLEPGKKYVLNYRLVVFNGPFTSEKADKAWSYYAQPPKIVSK